MFWICFFICLIVIFILIEMLVSLIVMVLEFSVLVLWCSFCIRKFSCLLMLLFFLSRCLILFRWVCSWVSFFVMLMCSVQVVVLLMVCFCSVCLEMVCVVFEVFSVFCQCLRKCLCWCCMVVGISGLVCVVRFCKVVMCCLSIVISLLFLCLCVFRNFFRQVWVVFSIVLFVVLLVVVLVLYQFSVFWMFNFCVFGSQDCICDFRCVRWLSCFGCGFGQELLVL